MVFCLQRLHAPAGYVVQDDVCAPDPDRQGGQRHFRQFVNAACPTMAGHISTEAHSIKSLQRRNTTLRCMVAGRTASVSS